MRWQLTYSFFFVSILGFQTTRAQEEPAKGQKPLTNCHCFVYPTLRPVDTNTAIDDRTYREIRSKIFSSLAGGQGQGGGLASFGSFDPVAGSFKLNYTQEIGAGGGKKPTDICKCTTQPVDQAPSLHSWFLSLSAGGNVIGNNIGVLFNNSKFNSGINGTAKLFIPLGNPSIVVIGQDAEKVYDKRRTLEVGRWMSKIQIYQGFDTAHINTNIAYANEKEAKTQAVRNGLRTSIGSFNGTLDSLYKVRNQLDSLVRDSATQKVKRDSLDRMLLIAENRYGANYANYGARLYLSIDTAFDNKLDSLNLSIPYSPYTLKWLAVVGTYSRSSYYTYFDTLPYSKQISNGKLSVFNYGLEFNLIHFGQKVMHYFNLGLLRIRSNNIGDLSASSLSRQIKTAENDTSQTVTQNYSVYTSPIVEYNAWNPYVNYYLFWGKTLNNQAVHLSASAEFRDTKQSPVNLGLGYIFSFKNSKDNSVINVEAFVKLADVFKALPEQEAFFYNRNSIGLQFGLPINIPSKSTTSK